uniref:Arrestin C-terminal-like domain-containing protein n=1 Tax=Heliothis virescens TaxID=7102 RepID=A0A2A4JQG5_HELVI
MGIFCQINLFKPPDGAFYSGQAVSGMIKYGLDEPMEIEKITVSLKGVGHLRLTERTNKKNRRHTYGSSEVYVDTDEVMQEGKIKIPPGSYELLFNFRLPQNVPPSIEYNKHIPRYAVNCQIKYYVRIKFARPGWFTFAKHFRKEITVASTIKPRLSMEPVIYGERSTLIQLFTSKPSTVIMKANVLNSVIPNGGKITIESEVQNDTNINIKTVEIKMMETYTFKAIGHPDVKVYEDIPSCECKTASIKAGATQNMPVDIVVPSDRVSLDNSKFVSRDYIVRITSVLPIPHRNVVLDIPVQIGDKVQRQEVFDLPPTYWEAMGEVDKEDDESDDEAAGDAKEGDKKEEKP